MSAVSHAERIIGLQENLTEDEMPPRWMWHLDHEMEAALEEIARKRNARAGGDTAPDWDSNEYAREWRDIGQ